MILGIGLGLGCRGKLKEIAALPSERDIYALGIDVWVWYENYHPCGKGNNCACNSGAEQGSEKWAAKGEEQPPGADWRVHTLQFKGWILWIAIQFGSVLADSWLLASRYNWGIFVYDRYRKVLMAR